MSDILPSERRNQLPACRNVISTHLQSPDAVGVAADSLTANLDFAVIEQPPRDRRIGNHSLVRAAADKPLPSRRSTINSVLNAR